MNLIKKSYYCTICVPFFGQPTSVGGWVYIGTGSLRHFTLLFFCQPSLHQYTSFRFKINLNSFLTRVISHPHPLPIPGGGRAPCSSSPSASTLYQTRPEQSRPDRQFSSVQFSVCIISIYNSEKWTNFPIIGFACSARNGMY